MRLFIPSFISKLSANPKKLFLIDCLGATLSASFLTIIYFNFQENIGLPKYAISYLIIIALCCAIYSFLCYLLIRSNWLKYISGVIIANLFYLIFTSAQVVFYYKQLKIYGWIYFCLDILVISLVIYIEWKIYKILKSKR
ncbi:MAG TPA: hypothetical protein PK431_12310 [Chitinophagales bacterium]|nr:hypothetical protein [Chitinophagales bacterium]